MVQHAAALSSGRALADYGYPFRRARLGVDSGPGTRL